MLLLLDIHLFVVFLEMWLVVEFENNEHTYEIEIGARKWHDEECEAVWWPPKNASKHAFQCTDPDIDTRDILQCAVLTVIPLENFSYTFSSYTNCFNLLSLSTPESL